MKYYIGVDGGGTKTHALCVTETGQEVGIGVSGPTNLTVTSVGSASFNLQEALRQALQTVPPGTHITCLAMGLAGIDAPAETQHAQNIFTQALQYIPIDHIILVNDTQIALENGTDEKNAVVLVSGTGSNCFGRNEHGDTAKAGGMDFLLTDEGSAYAIGYETLRAAVRSADSRGPKTLLEQRVCEHFQIKDIHDLKTAVYNPLISKMEVAEVAKVCTAAMDQGDKVATQIVGNAIDELFLMLKTVITKLQIADKKGDCVFVGGITKIPHVQTALTQQLHAFAPNLTVKIPEKDPVYGAIKIALDFGRGRDFH